MTIGLAGTDSSDVFLVGSAVSVAVAAAEGEGRGGGGTVDGVGFIGGSNSAGSTCFSSPHSGALKHENPSLQKN